MDAGILDLDLRFLEILVRGMAKIAAMPQDNPLHHQMNKYAQDDDWDDSAPPMGLAASQITEMKRMTESGVEFIQPEPEFVRCLEKPSYWNQLGSSKNSKSQQHDGGKESVQSLITETPDETIFCFTDGSCISKPGPCGAGDVIY